MRKSRSHDENNTGLEMLFVSLNVRDTDKSMQSSLIGGQLLYNVVLVSAVNEL